MSLPLAFAFYLAKYAQNIGSKLADDVRQKQRNKNNQFDRKHWMQHDLIVTPSFKSPLSVSYPKKNYFVFEDPKWKDRLR